MKNYNISVSDAASAAIETKAKAMGVDGRTYASITLDNLFTPAVATSVFTAAPIGRRRGKVVDSIDVGEGFHGYPALSFRLAQQFVDEALPLPRVKVRQYSRSIAFTPPFVFIDYPLSTRAKER